MGTSASSLRSRGTGTSPATCAVSGATLRDSVCFSTGARWQAPSIVTGAAARTTLRNVTAIATRASSDGLEMRRRRLAEREPWTAIERGSPTDAGFGPLTTPPPRAPRDDHDLANSNYRAPTRTSRAPTACSEGSGHESARPPPFANAARPAISTRPPDRRRSTPAPVDPLLGELDLDGEARTQGAAPDIGADELTRRPRRPTPPRPTTSRPTPGSARGRRRRPSSATSSSSSAAASPE